MRDDQPDRFDARASDDETRSLAGTAKRKRSRPEPSSKQASDDETRPLDTSGPLGSSESVSRQGSVTALGRDGARAADDSMTGRRVGRFIVLGTLGRGGMGTVYEAFDRTLDRRVAVKLLHHGVTTLDQQRLIREAQALAQLSHPNVVQVYEAGEIDSQSFVAMELVPGRTLRRWIAQEPRPDWRACVEIYMQAGLGLAAAHEQGLVHCDFKPSNAIVDDKGRVRVLDFGLARAAQEMVLDSQTPASHWRSGSSMSGMSSTETVAVMGTPAYMPLEQMEGEEVDARGDQFSFCVALYEAVYGERPFEEAGSIGELKEARKAELIVAAPRNTKVPVELREILVRGLAADPQRRWPSMQALLDRLRPLCSPRTRRNLLALGGVLALTGALAGAGLAYQTRMDQRCSGARTQLDGVWDDARRQQLEDAIVGTSLSYAADTWERVATPLDDYADAWVSVHTEVCEATSVRQEQSSAVMDLRMGCLRQRRVALREVVDVLLQADPTRVKQAVSLVASLPALSRCDDVETLQAELPPPEDAGVAEQVEALSDGLAQVRALRSAGAYDEALASAESIVAQADGLGHPPLRAEAMLEQGIARQELAQYEEAARDLERAYLLAAELEHSEVEAAAVRELAVVVGHDQAKHEAGLLLSKTALALARRPRADPREQAAVQSAIGLMLLRNGELEEALSHQERALAIFEAALGSDHPDIADLLHNMGNVLLQQGKQDDALTLLRRARAIREQALGPRHPHVAHSLTAIGVVLIQRGEWEPALLHLEQALIIREEAFGPRHPDVATSLNNIGAVLKQQGQLPQALDHFQRALDIQKEVLGARHPRVAYPLNNIGEVLREQGKNDEALIYLEQALAISEEALGPHHPDIASSAANLGNLLMRQDRYDEAEHQYRRALQIQQEALPADHPHIALSLLGLAQLGLVREDFGGARQHAEQAVSIRENAKLAPELLAEAHFVLARILWNEPRERTRSRSLAEQAHSAWSNAHSDDLQTREYLAEVEQWLAEHPPYDPRR